MPIQIPLVAGTLVWVGFLNAETGWLNGLLGLVGIQGPDWTNDATWVYPALTLIGLWGIGNFMLINISGLQSVPTELYEAARIDGAGAWSTFRRITIPLMSPILLYNLVISLIVTFQYFTQAYVLTNGRGDPNNATLFINLDLFRDAFVNNHMGYASAIGWLLFAIVLALTLALFAFSRKRVYYAAVNRERQRRVAASGVLGSRPGLPSHRRFLGRASMTLVAVMILSAFLLPLLAMVTSSFQQASQQTTPGAPIYPASPATGMYQGEAYDIYAVPIDGVTRNMMLVKKGRTESTFIDPTDPDPDADRLAGLVANAPAGVVRST